ncbi:MAG: endonuclease III [Bacteroidetes bacterium]|nr:endonuclease III [Bacteroidota bacterium]
MKIKERYEKVIAWFTEAMPGAETELTYTDPFELLVAVILSAQCTDKRVNLITPAIFEKYPDVYSMAEAEVEQIFELIKSCSYPNNKAKHLSGMAKMVTLEFEGSIPNTMDDLQKLPGVGRKTANVILSVAYKQPAMAVDTHVFRVAARIGLTTGAKTPYETEMQLIRHIPEIEIALAHHWLILHGRYVCTARNPSCGSCDISHLCRYVEKKSKS